MVDFQKLLDRDKYFQLRRILDTASDPITIYVEDGRFWIDIPINVVVLIP